MGNWYTSEIWQMAERMAVAVNGGDWGSYTDAQKRGWFLKAAFAVTELLDEPNVFPLAKEYIKGLEND